MKFILTDPRPGPDEAVIGKRLGFDFWYFVLWFWSYPGDMFHGPAIGITLER